MPPAIAFPVNAVTVYSPKNSVIMRGVGDGVGTGEVVGVEVGGGLAGADGVGVGLGDVKAITDHSLFWALYVLPLSVPVVLTFVKVPVETRGAVQATSPVLVGVGAAVGPEVGAALGADDGFAVGVGVVGADDGPVVGPDDGFAVGEATGAADPAGAGAAGLPEVPPPPPPHAARARAEVKSNVAPAVRTFFTNS